MMDQFKESVLLAAARQEAIASVRALYADLQQRIEQRRPLCSLSGRCCRFDEYGHRLYVTTLELAAFVGELRALPPAGADGPVGGCPYQRGKICTVHGIRPLGCRIFFCDPTSVDWQVENYEWFHGALKKLHEELDVPYFYVEWRAALKALDGAMG